MTAKCGNVQKVFVPLKEEKDLQTPSVSGIEITDLSVEKIRHFLNVEKKSPKDYGLKISVVKDGCSGNSYNMDIASIQEGKASGDKLFEKGGITVMIEKLSYLFVIGSTLDYVETLLMSGFQLLNPNVKKSCSCGSSVAFK